MRSKPPDLLRGTGCTLRGTSIHEDAGTGSQLRKGQILSETTLWITLTEEQSWLYSTPNPQEITIKCENEKEDKIVLDKTRKLSVNKKCTIVTPHITLCTQKAIATKKSQVYVPMFNLTLEYKSSSEIKNEEKIVKKNEIKTGYKRSARTNQVKLKHRRN